MAPKRDFRFTSKNGHHQTGPVGPVRANNRIMHRSKRLLYSITSSASDSKFEDSVKAPIHLGIFVVGNLELDAP
jgi:hypothetical protein